MPSRSPGVRWQEEEERSTGRLLQDSDLTQKVVNRVPGVYAAEEPIIRESLRMRPGL